MKQIIEECLTKALSTLKQNGIIPQSHDVVIQIDRTKDKSHGDFASNIALVLAKSARLAPRALAQLLIQHMPTHECLVRIEIAGPGFINFFVKPAAKAQVIEQILGSNGQYGNSSMGQGKKLLLEFVSANPNGPLHVGHGRGAAFGATLANILKATGYAVTCEYYVNDAGRQMNILALSVFIRYLSLCGEAITFPANGYQGDYVTGIAGDIFYAAGRQYFHLWTDVIDDLPPDEPMGGDKDKYVDALIVRITSLLGEDGFQFFHAHALQAVLQDIQDDVLGFGIAFDNWFSEKSLIVNGDVASAIQALRDAGLTYEQDGALWFKATAFDDEKDRVLIRANGAYTYFASDVAYHWNKYQRGFDRLVDIFGADHHGYVTRIKAAVRALGHRDEDLTVFLVQFAILYRSNERIQMSTRSGSFVTLRQLREEVGNDAARFFYVMRKYDQHMDFDLDLAKSQSNDNPVYYIQYAHARIASVLRQIHARSLAFDQSLGLQAVDQLTAPQEDLLIELLTRYPELLESAAKNGEPHMVAYYLRELANGLHSYYNAVQLLCDDVTCRSARLCLLMAVMQVLHHGLSLLGVSSPESM